jgi:hypothetical protein
MGLKCSPDFVHEVMDNIFRDVVEVEVYIDDIGIFSDSWEQHLAVLCIVIQKLQENGFTVNPLKCKWAVKKTDWLGYWLTPTCLNHGKRRLMQSLKCNPLNHSNSYVALWGCLISTGICGLINQISWPL